MDDERSTKKIKLSLEPSIDNKVIDITNTGQEIYKTEATLPEKLMQSVDRIWFERGEWKDITEKSLLQSIETKDQQTTQEESDQPQENLENALPTQAYDLGKLRESVINKLFHAKSEIDVALDVINILAAGNRSSATVKDLVLPNGSLTATYVTKPKQTPKAQLESVQLNLGLKRKKQKQASDFLKNSAASLKNIVEKEQVFWDEALDLRRNNWRMQSNTHPGGINAGSSFFVHYGFAEVGSDFNEASVGELKRAGDASKKLELALPHSNSKKMMVRIHQSHTGKLNLGQKAYSEGILGITQREEKDQPDYTVSSMKESHSDIQNQLAEAHATVFDAELFSDILTEAQALNSNVRFPDDSIVINIDGQIDLSIIKTNALSSTQPTSSKISTQHIISRTIDLSFRLLLIQHQKFNLWKSRVRILSSNHKIHQLLHEGTIHHATTPTTTSNIPNNATTTTTNNNTTTVNTVPGNTTVNNTNTITRDNNNTTSTVAPVTTTAATSHRARTKPKSNRLVTRDLPKEISILLPIMSLTRFWVSIDRLRQVVHSIIHPLTGGLSIAVHYKFEDCGWSKLSDSHLSYDVYPGHCETALSLGISLLKGPSLQFRLNQSGSISVHLPQTTVILQNVSEFEAFLSREIKVICLRLVCDVANEIIRRKESYIYATGSDKQRLLWKVDGVDEAIHGSIYWQSKTWRNINIGLKSSQDGMYALQFCLEQVQDIKKQVHTIHLNQLNAFDSAFNFKERTCVVVETIMDDAIMTLVK